VISGFFQFSQLRGYALNRRLPAANHLALAHIARHAPLDQTLACILGGIDDKAAGISGVIFLFDEAGAHLRPVAAPALHPDHILAIGRIALGPCFPLPATETGPAAEVTSAAIEASRFWDDFCVMARQHERYACAALPICSADARLLGVFCVLSERPEGLSGGDRQAMADASLLAGIAIERDAAEARIAAAESSKTTMTLAIEGSGTGIWDRNVPDGTIDYSEGWKAILGYAGPEVGRRIEDSYRRVHPDDLAYVQATMHAHFENKTDSYEVEHRLRCKDGSYKWVSSRGKVVSRDADGKALRMIGTTTDITALRALSERLQQSVDLITNLTNQVPGLVYQYRLMPNGDAFFPYASEGIREIYELTPEQVADSVEPVQRLIHPDDFPNYATSLRASAAGLVPWHAEYRVVLPRQGLCWRQADARPHRLPDGGTLWHGFITDITERKRIELELHEFATIDFLTQLPNRRCFMGCMGEELARTRRFGRAGAAVLMCDLDHFKLINDSHGHATGDLVLRHFADILRNELRAIDTAGRVGGEEFAVVLSGADVDAARIFAARVQKKLADTPSMKGGQAIALTVSIGIAMMNADDTGPDLALSRSDKALYLAKKNGRNRIEEVLD
jgi:diguanylate cyclase (GGDEF)-like protein/PAS domain S-box-containing protein